MRFARWLEEVQPIILASELTLFRRLGHDYQREAFIERFWRVRDPYPETGRNEMRERYEERIAFARANYGTLNDDRARILAVHGPPGREVQVRCTTTRIPSVIWAYSRSDEVDFGFLVVFVRGDGGIGPARVWRPGLGSLDGVVRSARACINGTLLDGLVRQIEGEGSDYAALIDRVLLKPQPRSMEWVAAFSAASTEVPAGAELFDAELDVGFLGRHQNRTVAQGQVTVGAAAATASDFGGYRSYDFLMVGEVLRNGRLFESFRVQYGFPLLDAPALLPLAFQRLLRPGTYRLVVRVEDLNSRRLARLERELVVPRLEVDVAIDAIADPETAELYDSATTSWALGETTVRIVPSSQELQTGLVRFDTLTTGAIGAVAFSLDDQPVVTKTRPPYNVELDLGEFPRLHVLRVEALDAAGAVVAADEREINAGGHRFSISFVEPRRGGEYAGRVEARVDARVPDGSAVERLELWVNEHLAATLYQEPFVQPLQLPVTPAAAYLRAVAYLVDGSTAEAVVFVNAPDLLEEVEVQFVEIFATVTDRAGRPIADLEQSAFRVREDGSPQTVSRFEKVENLPINVGILIDASASMGDALDSARRAALRFLEQAITARDRAAVMSFNRFPDLRVKLTNELPRLGGGLVGLTAEGQTALYDSLVFALYYLNGVSGQRAVLLLSDGLDEVSRFSYSDTLEYARRAGVAVYAIGLGVPDAQARKRLTEIAVETGGDSYFIRDIAELGAVYDRIQSELRGKYLVAYQSTNDSSSDSFRSVTVNVSVPGARVKAMSGYYP